MRTINSIFKVSFFLFILTVGVHTAYSQTASLLPVAPQQFFDKNGNPVTSGSVGYYIPGTSTPKMVWQDDSQTTPWSNPITLNAGGWPPNNKGIYGNGTYRQIIKDKNNNIISDQPTSATGSGGGSGTSVGDGNSVGTILTWSGMIAPNQYQFAYGQALSRTTYVELLSAITQLSSVTCIGGNTTLTGLSDTSNIPIGAAVEGNCIAATSIVTSKTLNTITLSIAATISTSTTVRFFPYGNGNGTTTFNVPDLRGRVIPGRNNMGGVVSSNLSSTYYGSVPDAVGAIGGAQSQTLTQAQIPSHRHSVFLNDPGHTHVPLPGAAAIVNGGTTLPPNNPGGGATFGSNPIQSAVTGITVRDASSGAGTTNQTALAGGGSAVSATVGNGGSSYTNGTQILTVLGGTCSIQPRFTVTVVGNVVTAPVLLTAGNCTTPPANAAATSGGGGTGATLVVAYSNSSFPVITIQPSITLNYIIKVTPDISVSGLFGVASIGGMQGVIACGGGITCAGNIISAAASSAGGSDTQVQYNSSSNLAGSPAFIWVNPKLTIGLNGTVTGQLGLAGATSGNLTQTVGSIAGTPIITWGNTSGTPAVTASAPLSINTTNGNLTITGAALTKTDDTNVTITLGGSSSTSLVNSASLTLGWTGTLAAGRLNSNVVQSIVNDTNINGSISAQALTFSWAGTLSVARGGTGAGTFTANEPIIGNGTSPLTQGTRSGNTTKFVTTTGALTPGDCVSIDANGNFIDAGTTCGGGGGGGSPGGANGTIQYNNAGSFGGFTTSGDATINTGTGALTLATVNSNVGSFGSATNCATFTTNGKGLITAASQTTCTPAIASITGFGTGVATALGTATSTTGGVPVIIAKGTITLGTSAISANTCASIVTVSATGVATTDVVNPGLNARISTVTGYTPASTGALRIDVYPTANNVNAEVCNPTSSSITPGAVTLNFQVLR